MKRIIHTPERRQDERSCCNKNPLVTIVCTAYNHERYIGQAIDSFLLQKTDFEVEILLHDDASTDRTRQIIENYAEKCPNRIRTIFQKENQYSHGVKILEHVCFPAARGKYIAVCEGDDLWTDDLKLQKQVDLLECNPKISMTCCNSNLISVTGQILKRIDPYKKAGYISAADIINSNRNMVSTCTVVFRKSVLKKRPEFYDKTMTSDFPLEVLCASNGRVYYFEDIMASYRTMVPGSWSQTTGSDPTHEKLNRLALTTSDFLLNFNKHTNNKYRASVYGKITRYMYNYIHNNGDTGSSDYKTIYSSLPLRHRMLLVLMKKYPELMDSVKNLRQG